MHIPQAWGLDQAKCHTLFNRVMSPKNAECLSVTLVISTVLRDKALYMSLAMVCKNEALDVVKTVTHKRG